MSEKKIKIKRKFSGSPEDIERLMAVQKKLIQLGEERKPKERAA